MPDFYISTVQPAVGAVEDTADFSAPTWKYITANKAGDVDTFSLILGKRSNRVTRLDMTKLLLYIPVIKQQMLAAGFSERAAFHVGLSLLMVESEQVDVLLSAQHYLKWWFPIRYCGHF
jgi:hypothetical protein